MSKTVEVRNRIHRYEEKMEIYVEGEYIFGAVLDKNEPAWTIDCVNDMIESLSQAFGAEVEFIDRVEASEEADEEEEDYFGG